MTLRDSQCTLANISEGGGGGGGGGNGGGGGRVTREVNRGCGLVSGTT